MIHQLEADSIQLRFHDREILRDIYVRCETGKITGLLGRNGAGKSSLMKIMHGTLACERSVRVDNISMREIFKRPDLLMYLPQFNFIPASLSLKRIFFDFDLDFRDFTEMFPEFASNYTSAINSLSGGGRRLVEVYTIVKSKTRFSLLDEPFTHLSPLQTDKIKQLIVAEKVNKGFFITDHMYQQVVDISDFMYVLVNGKTHLTNRPSDIEVLGYL